MVFNSLSFLLFFLVVLAVHNLPIPWRWKKVNLLASSYLFYAAWNPPFILLLWYTTVADFLIAHALMKIQRQSARRALLILSLVTNLGLLGFFKYAQFILDNFVQVLAAFGVAFRPALPDIILPIGISFYTFHTLSYVIDIYRRKTTPTRSVLDFALYVTFFPQLVAGPILRAYQFIPQCEVKRKATAAQMSWGLSLLCLGLFEKTVVADYFLAKITTQLYASPLLPDSTSAWCGTLAFAGQIFCDFAGYSTCALGVALCLGFVLPINFRYPYASIGFADFWQRWHISLSTWLRDYLYIPMGGNRVATGRVYVNLLVTMLLGGLWHGASWTFVVWGGLHGSFLVVERLLRARKGASEIWSRPPLKLLLGLVTFVCVCFAWVFFRAQSFASALAICRGMFGFAAANTERLVTDAQVVTVALATACILTLHWFMKESSLEDVVERVPWWGRSLLLASLLLCLFLTPGEDHAFIYFQF